MKKVALMPLIALVVLLMITPATAPATKTIMEGEFFGYFVDPGTQWTSEEGIVQIRDAVGMGDMAGDMPGVMTFIINAAFDPTTGEAHAWGKYVSTDNYGNTFEGMFLGTISNWGNDLEGKSVGQGTGAYEGMTLRNQFLGYNAYFGLPPSPYPKGTPIYFYWEGPLISPRVRL
jgi:hypothetical protein